MQHGPARETEYYSDDAEDRDPIDTLNYKELLNVCGTATNAFVNLASAGGIEARRLLLLDAQGMNTNHVVAEVHLDGRWVIVDPSFHAILKDSDGHLLTRQELASPDVLRGRHAELAGYDPAYNYRTHRISSSRAPAAGGTLSSNQTEFRVSVMAGSVNWTVLVERQSYATLIAELSLLCLALVLRR